MNPLPNPDDRQAVFDYAMSWNAYKEQGSFEATAELAKKAPRSNLEEVRAELFFKARASRHRIDDKFLADYKELLPLLEKFSKIGPA